MTTWNFHQPGYHGSPYTIDTLFAGSTITQDEALARVFSHKPQIVCLEDEPEVLARGVPRLRHNGTLPGLLYVIDEPIMEQDITPHPNSSMPPGLEWLTRRPLRLRLVGPVEPQPGEFLTPDDIAELMKRQG